MSAPFAPGDVVVCVDASPPRNIVLTPLTSLQERATYRVTALSPSGRSVLINGEMPHIAVGYSKPGGWDPYRFRKIDAADEEFAARIRACKPERVSC